MAENSGIIWTDHTFNLWIGCSPVSEACDHCYAEVQVKRINMAEWGPKGTRRRTVKSNWNKVKGWNRRARKTGIRERVFVARLADVFDNHSSIEQIWRDDFWALIKECPYLDFQLLTKRPQNIERYLPADWDNGYQNVWLGVTVENQPEAERRIPILARIPAVVRFLACEPLLGEIDASNWLSTSIDWVIVGGESAPDNVRRPEDVLWYRWLRDQCLAAQVPFLFKQYAGRNQRDIKLKGQLLDGKEWTQMPLLSLPEELEPLASQPSAAE